MRTYRTTSSPFTEKPFYTPDEVEQICVDSLQSVNLLPSEPQPIRIERFIEKQFKIYPTYEDLPEGVLGCIAFTTNGVKGIIISKSLSEEANKIAERRINTTLAHEAGHALLHTHLFVLGQKPESLFGNNVDSRKPKILCRNDAIQGIRSYKEIRYDGRWWEYQANFAIGPLLLPRSLIMISLEPFLVKMGMLEIPILNRGRQEEAVKTVAETFDVNPIVAKIRLDMLFPPSKDGQLTL
ncbi:MAG: hypothetical protein HY806_05425 [Nitrospirae bacterium]|nr:hypothetical protein [Nitrospirota bacterium]